MKLEDKWYWCTIEEIDEDAVAPDWDRVPEEKREAIRARWEAKNTVKDSFRLWGPQISFFQKFYKVVVI